MNTKIFLALLGVLNFIYMGMRPDMTDFEYTHLIIGALIAGLVGFLDKDSKIPGKKQ